ncbi:BCL6A transcription repressor b isoform X2 [Denticeps clupeoides]|nr:B-cell lymphoma 6 protein homolog isoform X2 [Denticeps clupeoides]
MYTSCLALKQTYIFSILNTAIYLQMDHVVDTCRRFLKSRGQEVLPGAPPLCSEDPPLPPDHRSCGSHRAHPPSSPSSLYPRLSVGSSSTTRPWQVPVAASQKRPCPPDARAKPVQQTRLRRPSAGVACTGQGNGEVRRLDERDEDGGGAHSPLRSDCQPNSPTESSGCSAGGPDTKVRNWKKYKLIVLNGGKGAVPERDLGEKESRTSDERHRTPGHLTREQPPSRGPPSGVWGTRDGPSPYSCDRCDAAFAFKGNLAAHKAVHAGEKPYRCTVCGAQFNRPANLKTHGRIHSGEKPYRCETCGTRFVQVAHLRAHVLIHTGEKPYPCGVCGTRFRHLQTLKSHMRIHTGEKPYHCEQCDVHFRHKSQLRLHLRQKHGAATGTRAARPQPGEDAPPTSQ